MENPSTEFYCILIDRPSDHTPTGNHLTVLLCNGSCSTVAGYLEDNLLCSPVNLEDARTSRTDCSPVCGVLGSGRYVTSKTPNQKNKASVQPGPTAA